MKTARIYRVIEITNRLNTKDLGVSWSFDMTAAEDFAKSWMMKKENCLLLSTVVNFDQINWKQTTANMNIPEYEEEFECFMRPNQNISTEVIWAGENVEKWEDAQFKGNIGNDEKEDETRASIEDITIENIEKLQSELLEWIETE